MNYYTTDFNVSKKNTVALEDSIMVKGSLTTAGSKILENFIAPFDATVVDRLRGAGLEISGKTRMKEFGISGFSGDIMEGPSSSVQIVADGAASYCPNKSLQRQ